VLDEFGFGADSPLASILDGGQSEVGIESTIVDLSRIASHGVVLLRPGHITGAQIEQVIGMSPRTPDAAAPRASGTLEAHYAPAAPVALIDTDRVSSTVDQLVSSGRRVALIRHAAAPVANTHAQLGLPSLPDGYAHDLYAALRAMDAVGADIILVEAPPVDSSWQGVNDRLRRAAHDSLGVLAKLLKDSV